MALLDGRADIAIHQLSELIFVPEAIIVGSLPAAVQEYTDFSTALGREGSRVPGAADLRDFLRSPQALAAYAANGLEPAERISTQYKRGEYDAGTSRRRTLPFCSRTRRR